MTHFSRFRSWLHSTLHRSQTERDMDAELRFHLETYSDDLMGNGVPWDEAFRRAHLEFGGLERAKEECRDARGITFLESLFQDIRYALRTLRNSPTSIQRAAGRAISILRMRFGSRSAITATISSHPRLPGALTASTSRKVAPCKMSTASLSAAISSTFSACVPPLAVYSPSPTTSAAARGSPSSATVSGTIISVALLLIQSPGGNLHASPPCNTSRSASGPKVRITTPKSVAGPSTVARAFRPRLFSPRHGYLFFSSRRVVFSLRPSLNWSSRPERPGIFLAAGFWHARSRRAGIVATNPNISPTRWTRRRLFPLLTEGTKRTLSR